MTDYIHTHYNMMFKDAFKSNESATEFVETLKKRYDALLKSYESKKLVIYTGAGVSYDIETISWQDLIHKVLYYRISNELNSESKSLWSCFCQKNETQILSKLDPLCAAEQLLCSLKHSGAYENNNWCTINEYKEFKLQKDVEEIIGKTPSVIDEKIFLASTKSIPNIIWLATLCIGNKSRVKKIITTNYDNYLDYIIYNMIFPSEEWLKIKSELSYNSNGIVDVLSECSNGYYSFKNNTFHSSNIDSDMEVINIKHVHGLVYYDNTINHSVSKGEMIFSESSYDELDIKPYKWLNMVQADVFLNNPILFIGFSGTDTNYRRLMSRFYMSQSNGGISKKRFMTQSLHNIYSYVENCFYKTFDINKKDDENHNIKKMDENIKHMKSVVDIFINLVKIYDNYFLEKLGVNVLWFNNFSYLSVIFKKLYEENSMNMQEIMDILCNINK